MPSDVDIGRVEQRIVEAAITLPAFGGLTGWAALHWLGGSWFDGTSKRGEIVPVDLAIGSSAIDSQPGTTVSQERLGPSELMRLDGITLTTAVRSVCFAMRYAGSTREAVEIFDMAAYDDLVSKAEIGAYALAHPGWTGIPQCRAAIELADENAWSPPEVGMRMIWILDADLPPPLCNRPIFDRSGRHLATPDLLDAEAGVAGEYDGPLHLAGAQRARDLRREEALRRVGLEYFTMVAADRGDLTRLVDRMRGVRQRARWTPESRREWTTTPPPWWTSTFTVEQRRALTESQRARFLGYRRRAA